MTGRRVLCILVVLWCCGQNCLAAEGDQSSNPTAVVPDCVKLNSSDLPSSYVSMPTSITIRPQDPQWSLEFTLHGPETEDPLVCVGLQNVNRVIRMSLFEGHCGGDEEEEEMDSQLWTSYYVTVGEWTMVDVTHNETAILLKTVASGGSLTPLGNDKIALPKDKLLLRVTNATSTDVALGCRVNCPALPNSPSEANTTEFSTIAELKNKAGEFFVWPGEDFQMNLAVQCETERGQEVQVAKTTVTREQIGDLEWHKINLDFNDEKDFFRTRIDGRLFRKVSQGLHVCETFRSFSVEASGEGYVSFTCDPVYRQVNNETLPGEEIEQRTLTGGDIVMFIISSIIVIGLNVGVVWAAVKLTAWEEKHK